MSEKLTNEQMGRIIDIAFYMPASSLYKLKFDKNIETISKDELLSLYKDKGEIEVKNKAIDKVKEFVYCFVDNLKNLLKQTGINVDSIDFNSGVRLIDLVGADNFRNIHPQLISLSSDLMNTQTQTQPSVFSTNLANIQIQNQSSVDDLIMQAAILTSRMLSHAPQPIRDEFRRRSEEINNGEVFNEILENLYAVYGVDAVEEMNYGELISAMQQTSPTAFQNLLNQNFNLGCNVLYNSFYNQNYFQNNTSQNFQAQQVSSINQNQPQNSVNNTIPAQNPFLSNFSQLWNWSCNMVTNYFFNPNQNSANNTIHNTNQNFQAQQVSSINQTQTQNSEIEKLVNFLESILNGSYWQGNTRINLEALRDLNFNVGQIRIFVERLRNANSVESMRISNSQSIRNLISKIDRKALVTVSDVANILVDLSEIYPDINRNNQIPSLVGSQERPR